MEKNNNKNTHPQDTMCYLQPIIYDIKVYIINIIATTLIVPSD